MKKEEKKKGFFSRLFGIKEENKCCGCCNFEIEEIQEDGAEAKNKAAEESKESGKV